MRTFIPALFLSLVFAFFIPAVPAVLRRVLRAQPRLVFAVPAILSAIFLGMAGFYGILSTPLVLLVLAYAFVPTACAFVQGPFQTAPSWLDFTIMLMLWLPVELNAGAPFIPREIQGLAHIAIYGIGLTLALVLLRTFRDLSGMKFNVPARWSDAAYVVAALLLAAAILIPLGLYLDFLASPHSPRVPNLLLRFLAIWAGTALPEEILFRALIQNWLMQKFGPSDRTLCVAALIFGCSHLNNGPGPLPNWRYAILATIAGYLYGKVFQKASSIMASATLHALVNTVRHGFL